MTKSPRILITSSQLSMKCGITTRYLYSVTTTYAKSWLNFSQVSIKWTMAKITSTRLNSRLQMRRWLPYLLLESTNSKNISRKSTWYRSLKECSINFYCLKGRGRMCRGLKSERVYTVWRVVISIWMPMQC